MTMIVCANAFHPVPLVSDDRRDTQPLYTHSIGTFTYNNHPQERKWEVSLEIARAIESPPTAFINAWEAAQSRLLSLGAWAPWSSLCYSIAR